MTLSWDAIWPSATQETDKPEDTTTLQPDDSQTARLGTPLDDCHDPYIRLPVIATGMTGIIHRIGEDRAVKKAKKYPPGSFNDPGDAEYVNQINQETLENEAQVFERPGSHKGIIPCFRTSQHGIELVLVQGDLESYLEDNSEPDNAFKIAWISSLAETFSYIHSRRVFVDDIALRNILVLDGQLKLADFGQSTLLPLDVDMSSVKENDMTVQIEMLHIGWIIYSISSWHVYKYYFFSPENPDCIWPELGTFPNVDGALCGEIIKKCWRGEYASMNKVTDELQQFLTLR